MVIRAPYGMPAARLEELSRKFEEKFNLRLKKQRLQKLDNLMDVFLRLNRKYFDGRLAVASIEFSMIQNKRYGSVSLKSRKIRISHQLASMPAWVRDYVVMHEMAHLIEPNHGPAFWKIVNRYKLTERARGFLMAMDYTGDEIIQDEAGRQKLLPLR